LTALEYSGEEKREKEKTSLNSPWLMVVVLAEDVREALSRDGVDPPLVLRMDPPPPLSILGAVDEEALPMVIFVDRSWRSGEMRDILFM